MIVANHAQGLKITGTGNIQGRAKEFMTRYDDAEGMVACPARSAPRCSC